MTNDIRLIDKIRAETTAYGGYSLNNNPFPETGRAPQHPNFCAGRSVALNKIYEFVADVYNHESISGLVVLGTIGGGKTHILRYVRDAINGELENAPSGKALAIYVENPQTGVLHIYSEFMNEIEPSLLTNVLWKVVSVIISREIGEGKLTFDQVRPEPGTMQKWFGSEQTAKELLNVTGNLESLRDQIARGNLSRDRLENLFIKYLEPHISDKDFLRCSVKLLLEDNVGLLNESWNFICGSRVSKDVQKTLGLLKSSLDPRDVNRSIFKSVTSIFREAGYRVVFLLLDEVETFATFGSQTRFAILDEFRSFFDALPSNFGIILACAPRAWQQIISTYPALRDRIKHVVELGYLKPEETLELIRAYLASARTKEIPDNIYPFSKDAIFEISRLKRGVVRYIVEACHVLLKEGAKKEFPPITKRFVTTHIRPIEPSEATLIE
jgi:Cdc6-like AAA superfamily ATPase